MSDVIEKIGVFRAKDDDGNEYAIYPETKIDAVEGLGTTLNQINGDVSDLQEAFQDGCDTIVAGCTTYGSTPTSNSPADIVTSIGEIYDSRYSTGYDSGYNQGLEDATPTLQAKTATLKTSAQTIKADSGYDGLSQVTVPAVTGTAGLNHVLSGKTFNSATAGIGKTGTMANKAGTSVKASSVTSDDTNTYFTIPANGYYSTASKIYAENSNLKGNEVTVDAIDDDPYERGHYSSDGMLVFETGLTEIYGIINLNIYSTNSAANWGDLTSLEISGGTVIAYITGSHYMKGSITVKGK